MSAVSNSKQSFDDFFNFIPFGAIKFGKREKDSWIFGNSVMEKGDKVLRLLFKMNFQINLKSSKTM